METEPPIKDSTTDVGVGNAAELLLLGRLKVDVSFRTQGGEGTMTVEVSNDGYEWHPFDEQTHDDEQEVYQYSVPWTYVRAYADENLGKIELSAQYG